METEELLDYDLAAVRRMAERISRVLDEAKRAKGPYPPPSLAEVREFTEFVGRQDRVEPMPDSIMSWAGVSSNDAVLQRKP